METKIFWICGKHRGYSPNGASIWDLQGLFDTEQGAIDACVDSYQDFIGPVPLNQKLPQDPTSWPGCRFPLAKDQVSP